MVWLQVVELLCASVAVQVRLVLLTSCPLVVRAAPAKVTVRLASQASLNTGVPNCGVAGHSMVALVDRKSVVEGERVSTVRIWLQVDEVWWAAVAVQVRWVLLLSLQRAVRAGYAVEM